MERIMSSRNLTQLTDFYQLTMMQGYFFAKDVNETVVFDAFYRTNPDGNGYAVSCGLDQLIDYINDLHFTEADRTFTTLLLILNIFARQVISARSS